jgi:hypothetical protein
MSSTKNILLYFAPEHLSDGVSELFCLECHPLRIQKDKNTGNIQHYFVHEQKKSMPYKMSRCRNNEEYQKKVLWQNLMHFPPPTTNHDKGLLLSPKKT